MDLRNCELGVWVAFEYLTVEGVWMPRTGILKRRRDTDQDPLRNPRQGLQRGRWIFLLFDVARGGERWFYNCRMRHVRPVQAPAIYTTRGEANAFAAGWEEGSPDSERAVSCARFVHGKPQKWLVIATQRQMAS